MLSAILGFFTALPDLLKLIQSVMAYVNQVSGNNPSGWANQIATAFDNVRNAKTQDEKSSAAASLAGVIAGL